jgi:hypothetical protein
MKLFHGTSDTVLDQVAVKGLHRPNLTESQEIAELERIVFADKPEKVNDN